MANTVRGRPIQLIVKIVFYALFVAPATVPMCVAQPAAANESRCKEGKAGTYSLKAASTEVSVNISHGDLLWNRSVSFQMDDRLAQILTLSSPDLGDLTFTSRGLMAAQLPRPLIHTIPPQKIDDHVSVFNLQLSDPGCVAQPEAMPEGDVATRVNRLRKEQTQLQDQLLAIPQDLTARYSEFLKLPGTGIIKLFQRGQYENIFSLRGGASYYSFTRRTHEYGQGSDIELEQGSFRVGFAGADCGFFVNLGTGSIEDIQPNANPPGWLNPTQQRAWTKAWSCRPPQEIDALRKEVGPNEGHTIVLEGGTYLLRSISPRRSDTLTAFHVERMLSDGSVILVWRLLSSWDPLAASISRPAVNTPAPAASPLAAAANIVVNEAPQKAVTEPGEKPETIAVEPGTGGVVSTRGIFTVQSGVSVPTVLFRVDPEYSEEARAAKYEGAVLVAFTVDTEGYARDIRVVESLGMGLDEKATEAIAKWKFKPGTRDGIAVNVPAQIEVNFKLPLLAPAKIVAKEDMQKAVTEPARKPATAADPKVGCGVTSAPSVLSRVDVEFPEDAHRSHDPGGTVLLSVVIDTEGRATDIRVVKGLGANFDEKAIECVAKWKFRPGLTCGKPMRVRAQIEVNFRLL